MCTWVQGGGATCRRNGLSQGSLCIQSNTSKLNNNVCALHLHNTLLLYSILLLHVGPTSIDSLTELEELVNARGRMSP